MEALPAVGPRYVIVSGLPGSGKSTLAHALAPHLDLPVIDKDDELESLFETRGIGSAEDRRTLSRESDERFRKRAIEAGRGLLVSFWHLEGMPADSGTPTDWLDGLLGPRVHLWCRCPVDEALRRFVGRRRHPGHCDAARAPEEIRAQLVATSALEPLAISGSDEAIALVEVDLHERPDPVRVAEAVVNAARVRV